MARSDTESVPPTSLAINKTQRPSLIDLSLLLCRPYTYRCYREFLLQVVGVLIVGSFVLEVSPRRVTKMSRDQMGEGYGPRMLTRLLVGSVSPLAMLMKA